MSYSADRLTAAVRGPLLAAALLASGAASGTLTLPGGDSVLDGSFAGLQYGATGTAYVTPLLFVSQFASTQTAAAQVLGTDLDYQYGITGLGTSLVRIDYSVRNTSVGDIFTDLRFMLNVEPSGSTTFQDTVVETWGAKTSLDPDARQVANYDPANTLLNKIITNNGVIDGANECLALACDADFGLQWRLAQLLPGETWTINVGLSDGSALPGSQRFLRAVSLDTADTMLTVAAIPEPSTYLLFAAGLGVVVSVRRFRAGNRA